MIGQMQGKFQMEVVMNVGHMLQEVRVLSDLLSFARFAARHISTPPFNSVLPIPCSLCLAALTRISVSPK
jgi:hypothetical protein